MKCLLLSSILSLVIIAANTLRDWILIKVSYYNLLFYNTKTAIYIIMIISNILFA